MRAILSLGKFVLSMIAITGLSLLIIGWTGYDYFSRQIVDVTILKKAYPVVRYLGPQKPPKMVFQKTKPASWTTLNQISKPAVGAIVVSEDWAFYQHGGFDANQIKEAIREDWEEGRFARGASTITQQVAKNVFLEKDKNLWRKLKEFYVAVKLEKSVGKKKILEVYLNVAEWGEGIFGIQAASRFYFKKAPSELTAKEGAFLAMLLPSPKRYSQSFRKKALTQYARGTVNDILDKMAQARYIDDDARQGAKLTPLSFETHPNTVVAGSEEAPTDGNEGEPQDSLPGLPDDLLTGDPSASENSR